MVQTVGVEDFAVEVGEAGGGVVTADGAGLVGGAVAMGGPTTGLGVGAAITTAVGVGSGLGASDGEGTGEGVASVEAVAEGGGGVSAPTAWLTVPVRCSSTPPGLPPLKIQIARPAAMAPLTAPVTAPARAPAQACAHHSANRVHGLRITF